MEKRLYIAIATLIGTTIGAGILGIPYVIAKVGLFTGLLVILGIGLAVMAINLYMGEVVLRTKGNHQLPGYASKYLGRWGKGLMMFSMVFGVYGALIAYTIGEGEAIRSVVNGGSPVLYSLLFLLVAIAIVFLGIKTMGRSELFSNIILLMVVVLIVIFSIPRINANNLTGFNISKILIPYGVILFAFMASPAIPEMKEELEREKGKLKKAIIIGSFIPLVVYIIFAIVVVGVVGINGFNLLEENERVATVALGIYSGRTMTVFANLFAVLTMSTSFFALGVALKEMYQYDYRLNKKLSSLLVFIIPFSVFFIDALVADITNFMQALEVAGAVSGGIGSGLIVLMFWKAKKIGDRKPEYSLKKNSLIGGLLILVFVLGIIYEILKLLGVY